jgi:hypothetical protein
LGSFDGLVVGFDVVGMDVVIFDDMGGGAVTVGFFVQPLLPSPLHNTTGSFDARADDGRAVGSFDVGANDGKAVGFFVVGANDGRAVGFFEVGANDGRVVGFFDVGADDGRGVGAEVGLVLFVGFLVGDAV